MRASIAFFGVCLSMVASAQGTSPAPAMRDAARTFLDALEPAQKEEAFIPFNAEARLDWHYVPRERPGLSLKKMTPEQQEKALAVMQVALSERGFEKTETIRSLDAVLHKMQNNDPSRDPELYDLAVFGDPSETEPWGLRYEGHHISLNWTVIGDKVIASTPQFLGSNPAEVRDGEPKGTRALAVEEDLGRSLVTSLDEAQRGKGVLGPEAPREIITGADREAAILEDRGVAYGELTESQQGILLSLISEYAGAMPPAVAKDRIERLKAAGIENLKFAWMGGLEKGQGHYYRVQGPTFLIEYDNTQNGANHIHTVWRDFKGDFGRDLLAEHYRRHADSAHPGTHDH